MGCFVRFLRKLFRKKENEPLKTDQEVFNEWKNDAEVYFLQYENDLKFTSSNLLDMVEPLSYRKINDWYSYYKVRMKSAKTIRKIKILEENENKVRINGYRLFNEGVNNEKDRL